MTVNDLRIGRRLGLGFLVVVMTSVVLTGLGVMRVEQIKDRLSTINDMNSVKQRFAIDFRGNVHDRAISLRDVVIATSPEQARPELELIERLSAEYEISAQKLDQMVVDAEADADAATDDERAALERISEVEAATVPLIAQVIQLWTGGDTAGARTVLMQRAKPLFGEWLAAINAFIDLQESMNQVETARARSIAGGFMLVMVLLCALAMMVAAGVAVLITRSIVGPLSRAVTVLSAVERGDLTQRIGLTSRDEIGMLGRSLDAALVSVSEVMRGFDRSIGGMESARVRLSSLAGEIAAGAEDSSAQANLVAAAAGDVSRNVQTVAEAADEVSLAIREISSNAQQAADVASRAMAVMNGATTTVSRLGESSRTIGDVVAVISSIAAQTNLLALNATIEAARAGDAGRGFAVVAHEVKELSDETARATQDISRRVEAIKADTAQAVEAIGEASQVMTQMYEYQGTISAAVEKQSGTTFEINRSVGEAASGSAQIADNIGGVALAARATTESVGQSRETARQLDKISAELVEMVGRFRF